MSRLVRRPIIKIKYIRSVNGLNPFKVGIVFFLQMTAEGYAEKPKLLQQNQLHFQNTFKVPPLLFFREEESYQTSLHVPYGQSFLECRGSLRPRRI